jgi:hypothetical protein
MMQRIAAGLIAACLVATTALGGYVGASSARAMMTARYAAAPLLGAGGSAVRGAVAIVGGGTALSVFVSVTGLRPGTTYSAAIRSGTCGQKKPVAYNLPALTAAANGAASLATHVPSRVLPFMGWYLTVTERDAAQTPIACGILFGPDMTITIRPAGASKVNGVAIVLGNMDTRGGMAGHDQGADVVVLAQGLPPGTVHADHLHLGACGSNGAVKYPLTPLVADRDGNAVASTFFKDMHVLRPGLSLYIHDARMRPIACGNVTGHMPSM